MAVTPAGASATWKDLAQEVGKAVFDNVSRISPENVEGLFVGSVQPNAFQNHVASLVAERLGIDVSTMIARTELACASGQAALTWLAIAAGQLDVAEINDCFSISEIIEYERLGFCDPGKGGQFIEDGHSHLDSVAGNPRGGLLAVGIHSERRASPRRSKSSASSVATSLIHNLSGSGSVHSVMTLARERQ